MTNDTETREERIVDITFAADFFVLSHRHHTYEGLTDEEIISGANEFLKDYYGFDIESLSHHIEIEDH